MIAAFYTAAGVPVGLFLILCAFSPDLTRYLSNLHLALAAAGIATLFLAGKGLFAD